MLLLGAKVKRVRSAVLLVEDSEAEVVVANVVIVSVTKVVVVVS